jgi:BMFP domain-containing protein YqiC
MKILRIFLALLPLVATAAHAATGADEQLAQVLLRLQQGVAALNERVAALEQKPTTHPLQDNVVATLRQDLRTLGKDVQALEGSIDLERQNRSNVFTVMREDIQALAARFAALQQRVQSLAAQSAQAIPPARLSLPLPSLVLSIQGGPSVTIYGDEED